MVWSTKLTYQKINKCKWFFFFLMDKITCINHKKQQSCPLGVYKRDKARRRTKNNKKRRTHQVQKKIYLYPIQVRNSNKLLSLSPLDTLDMDQKLQMKEFFNLYAEKVSLSKATLFISHHTVQKRQRGAALQTFLRFLPTLVPCQTRRTRRTKKGKTHPNPMIAKISSQSILAFGQCTRRWFRVSSSSSHR